MSLRPFVGRLTLALGSLALVAVATRNPASTPLATIDPVGSVKHLVWLNNWAEAADRVDRLEAISALPKDPETNILFAAVKLRGRIESQRLPEAAEKIRNLLQSPEALQDPNLRLVLLSALGDILFQYDLQGAQTAWTEAQGIASRNNDDVWEARCDGELGTIAFLNGNVFQAVRLVSAAALRAETNDDVASQIRYSTALGEGLVKFGRYPDALKFFDRALRIHNANDGSYFPFTAFIGKARLLALTGDEPEGLRMLVEGLSDARHRDQKVRQARLLAAIGEMAQAGGRVEEAHRAFADAADLAAASGMHRIESDVTTQLAAVALKMRGPSGAMQYAQRSVQAADRAGDSYSLPQKLAVLAEVQSAQGRVTEAEVTYWKATDLVDSLLKTVPYSKDKSTVIGAMERVFLGHFELALERQKDPAKAFEVLESARAQGLLEIIRQPLGTASPLGASAQSTELVTLNNRLAAEAEPSARRALLDRLWETEVRAFRPAHEQREVLRPWTIRVEDVQQSLGHDEVLVEYVLGPAKSFALAIARDQIQGYRLRPRSEIEAAVAKYMGEAKSLQDATLAARRLHQLLLEPVELSHSAKRLIVVPDGKLHEVPFDALLDSSNSYLLAKKVVSYAPSASVNFYLSRARMKHRLERRTMLAVGGVRYGAGSSLERMRMALRGGSLFNVEAPADLAPLPGAVGEISEITSLSFGGADTLTGEQATESALKASNLPSYEIVHFAVHASIDEEFPGRSALRLAKDRDPDQDGLLQAREIMELPLNAELVTISACDAGSGRTEGIAGMNSLVQAFLMAGARTVVASTWPAEDNATRVLMRAFYQHLRNGADKAEALTLAKRDLLAKYGSNAQPFLWAGFRLVGDSHGVIGD